MVSESSEGESKQLPCGKRLEEYSKCEMVTGEVRTSGR